MTTFELCDPPSTPIRYRVGMVKALSLAAIAVDDGRFLLSGWFVGDWKGAAGRSLPDNGPECQAPAGLRGLKVKAAAAPISPQMAMKSK